MTELKHFVFLVIHESSLINGLCHIVARPLRQSPDVYLSQLTVAI